jgi:hypothetical protein
MSAQCDSESFEFLCSEVLLLPGTATTTAARAKSESTGYKPFQPRAPQIKAKCDGTLGYQVKVSVRAAQAHDCSMPETG